ncbi:hypothetical protein ACRAWD_25310 [Caulobacter segnis]
MLRQEAKRVDVALRLLSAARLKLAQHGDLSSDDPNEPHQGNDDDRHKRTEDLSAAYQAIATKHFTSADRNDLAANGYQGMDKPDTDWTLLHQEATRA